MILGFTRAMGEFGATVTLAGNIPGRTQTLSSAIYSAHSAGNWERGNVLLVVALVVGFAAIFLTEWLARPRAELAGGKNIVSRSTLRMHLRVPARQVLFGRGVHHEPSAWWVSSGPSGSGKDDVARDHRRSATRRAGVSELR